MAAYTTSTQLITAAAAAAEEGAHCVELTLSDMEFDQQEQSVMQFAFRMLPELIYCNDFTLRKIMQFLRTRVSFFPRKILHMERGIVARLWINGVQFQQAGQVRCFFKEVEQCCRRMHLFCPLQGAIDEIMGLPLNHLGSTFGELAVAAAKRNEWGITQLYLKFADFTIDSKSLYLAITATSSVTAKDLLGEGHQPCHEAQRQLLRRYGAEFVKLLLDGQFEVSPSLLFTMTKLDCMDLLEESILQGRLQIDPRDRRGETPLFKAALRGDLSMVQRLLSLGAVPPPKIIFCTTNVDILEMLIRAGSDIHVVSDKGNNVLERVVLRTSCDLVEFLERIPSLVALLTDKVFNCLLKKLDFRAVSVLCELSSFAPSSDKQLQSWLRKMLDYTGDHTSHPSAILSHVFPIAESQTSKTLLFKCAIHFDDRDLFSLLVQAEYTLPRGFLYFCLERHCSLDFLVSVVGAGADLTARSMDLLQRRSVSDIIRIFPKLSAKSARLVFQDVSVMSKMFTGAAQCSELDNIANKYIESSVCGSATTTSHNIFQYLSNFELRTALVRKEPSLLQLQHIDDTIDSLIAIDDLSLVPRPDIILLSSRKAVDIIFAREEFRHGENSVYEVIYEKLMKEYLMFRLYRQALQSRMTDTQKEEIVVMSKAFRSTKKRRM